MQRPVLYCGLRLCFRRKPWQRHVRRGLHHPWRQQRLLALGHAQNFADNGISYTEKGIMTGNYSGGVAAGTSYGGRIFQNLHSSAASARTYEIAGRTNSSSYGRFDGSNIKNWLGLSTEKPRGEPTRARPLPGPTRRTRFSCSPAPTTSFPTTTTVRCTCGWTGSPTFC